MTASALNSAYMSAPAGASGATAGATANAAAGAAGGFEALMAGLFPQGAAADTPAPGPPAAPQASAPAPGQSTPADDEDAKATDGQAAPPPEGDTVVDPASTLAAALAAQQQVAIPPQTPTTAAEPTSGNSAPAWGHDKAKGLPAQPALANANPKADLLDKNGLTPEAEGEGPAPTGEAADAAVATAPKAPTPEAPAPARAKAAQPNLPTPTLSNLPTPAAANMPAAVSEAPVEAALPPVSATDDAAPPTTATVQAETQVAARAGSKAEAPATPAPRASRGERKGPDLEGRADHLKPLEAADKPVHAKAVDAAARAAAATGADDAKPSEPAQLAETEASLDTPDATPAADAKAAAQSSAPAAQAAHTVRGAPETVANLAAQIVKKLEGQSTRFDIELNPHGLGKVDVRIEIGAQGQLTAAMLFDNAQAAHELKSRATELQRALEQAGFNLSDGLSFDVADQGRQQGQAWQDQSDNGRAFRGQAFRAALETAGEADSAAQGALRLRRGVNAGLDVRI